MKTQDTTSDTQRRIQTIWNLDLECIKFKLLQPRTEGDWTLEKADRVELAYKRFLILNLKHKDTTIVPNRDIDIFWHYHILDTEKYAEDCQSCFGCFLHHFPYSGLRGSEDLANLKSNYRATQEIYMIEFGEPMVGDRSSCEGDDPESCNPDYDCDTNGYMPNRGTEKVRPRVHRATCAAISA